MTDTYDKVEYRLINPYNDSISALNKYIYIIYVGVIYIMINHLLMTIVFCHILNNIDYKINDIYEASDMPDGESNIAFMQNMRNIILIVNKTCTQSIRGIHTIHRAVSVYSYNNIYTDIRWLIATYIYTLVVCIVVYMSFKVNRVISMLPSMKDQ